MESYVTHLPNVFTFHEKENGRPGILKTAQNTDDYQIRMETMLRRSNVFFSRELFTTSKKYEKANGDTRAIKDELRLQLERYHWEIEAPTTSFGREKVTLTGKMGGLQDDLYIATAMAMYWGRVNERRYGRLEVV